MSARTLEKIAKHNIKATIDASAGSKWVLKFQGQLEVPLGNRVNRNKKIPEGNKLRRQAQG